MREFSIGIAQGLDPVLTPSQIEQLRLAGSEVKFAKDEQLYRQGEKATRIYLLTTGRVNTFLVNGHGLEALLRIHLPGSVMGLTALASRQIRDASAVAVEDSEAIALSKVCFQELLRADAQLGEYFLKLLLDRMSDFHYRVGELFSQTVEKRLSTALLALSQPDASSGKAGQSQAILLTHEELAHLLNTRRPTVSTVLGRFASAGLIKRSGQGIVVTDRDGLARVTALSAKI